MNSHQLEEQKTNYIIDTDVGGDIDDTLALIVAMNSHSKPLAITTNHIEPEEKAKIAKLIVSQCGHEGIPVYAGIGCKRTDPKSKFIEQNPLFPSVFGYPNPDKGDKTWYPSQAIAYKETYGSKFDEMKIEKETAPEIIVKIAKKYSPDNKLTVIALGPLHNIDAALKIDPTIAKNIKLFAMGGVYPKGYNWLISPEVTSRVISKIETYVITNELIVQNKLFITRDELTSLVDKIKFPFGETVLNDWKNWHKADHFNKKDTNLYDPVTVYLALHPHLIASSASKKISFPCLDQKGELRQSDFKDCWYFKPELDNKIVSSKMDPESYIKFVNQLTAPAAVKDDIFSKISLTLTKPDLKSELSLKSGISLIKNARRAFLDSPTKLLSNGLVKIFIEESHGKKYRIFGVKKEDQEKIDFTLLRKEISKELDFKENKLFTQVIGDSSTFSEHGTHYAKKHVSHFLSDNKENIILYGWTGNLSKNKKEADTNQLVSEWIDQKPEHANHVIANIVDEHTITAIENWNLTFSPNILNYFLVYSDGLEPSVKFGDDTISSDNLTNHKVLCLEGGIQSLRQLIYMLKNNIQIEGAYGLRDDKNIEKAMLVSAIEFLSLLKKQIINPETTTKEDIQKLVAKYLSTHILYNTNKYDSGTKERLFKSAMQEFYENEIWKKLSLLQSKPRIEIETPCITNSDLGIFSPTSNLQNGSSIEMQQKCKL